MGAFQLLMTAISLAAAVGGTAGAERLLDRYGRPPAAEAPPALIERSEDGSDVAPN